MRYLALFLTSLLLIASSASAETTPGLPFDWQMGLQPAASPLAIQTLAFHNNILLPLATAIALLVIGLLCYTCWRFSEKRNKKPSKRINNELLEIIWTLVPTLILVALIFPSVKLIVAYDEVADAEMTVKVTGNQWYWTYEYPDAKNTGANPDETPGENNGENTGENISFDSILLQGDELGPDGKRMLDTDNPLVLPTGTKIRLLITSSDVIHSWSVPAFAIKMDAVPGRLNETWVEIDAPGTYYGFCSELCGRNHSYMPIMVRAVSKQEFQAWLTKAKQEFASAPETNYFAQISQ